MIKKISYIFIFSLICIFSQSCSNDDEIDLNHQENVVTKKVYSNTPGVPIELSNGGTLIIKDKWEETFTTDAFVSQLTARCEDKTVLITVEIYVNGKLRVRRDGNSYIKVSVNLKGNPQ